MPVKTLRQRLRKVLLTKPRKFQVQGIRFLEKAKGRALLGDDMGLGKTLQVLGWLALHPEARPVVIACPANAKYEWEDQLYQHTRHLECEVVTGQKPYKIDEDIIIINYDILPFWENMLLAMKPSVLIMDECHYVKTRNIKRTIVCKNISKIVKHVIPMSGTPVVNRPVEFFPVLNMLYPKEFRSFWKYAFRYCAPKKGFRGKGWIFTGAINTKELHKQITPFMIRRMKSEVLTELPPKQRIVIPIDLSNRREYDHAKNDFLGWYKKQHGVKRLIKAKRAEGFVKVGQLKQLAAQGKIDAAIRWIDDYLDSGDKKLVVFCCHRVIFNILTKQYSKIAAVGGKAGRRRGEEVKRFQTDNKTRLFIGSLKADREAITLTTASSVLFIEMGWTPGEHDQAEDRINRIGQTADSITAYYLIARNSIDEKVWDIIEKKRRIIAQILDGEEASDSAKKQVSLNQLIKNLHT